MNNTLLCIWCILEGLFICYLIHLLKGLDNMTKHKDKEHTVYFYISLALSASVCIACFCIMIKNMWG